MEVRCFGHEPRNCRAGKDSATIYGNELRPVLGGYYIHKTDIDNSPTHRSAHYNPSPFQEASALGWRHVKVGVTQLARAPCSVSVN